MAEPVAEPAGARLKGFIRSIRSRSLRWMSCSGFVAISMSPAGGVASGISEYRCTPDVKHECTAAGCETMNNGFQHAELFAYRPKKRELSVCLWTNCYAGSATVFTDTASGTFTAIGRLEPTAHPGNEPVIVTLTIETPRKGELAEGDATRFTAVWGYGSEGLALDMGRCVPYPPPSTQIK